MLTYNVYAFVNTMFNNMKRIELLDRIIDKNYERYKCLKEFTKKVMKTKK